MRIGINTLFMIPGHVGGTETYLRNLLRALSGIDTENEYFIYTNVENAGSFAGLSARFREISCYVRAKNRPWRIVFEQTTLPMLVARQCLDVLHSPGYTAPLMLRCASVVTMHDMNYHYFPEDWNAAALWTNRLLLPRVARHSTRILTVSDASRQAIVDVLRVPNDKLDVVYSGIDGNLVEAGPADEEAVRAKYNLPEQFILSVTASHPHKNLAGLVRSYAIASREWDETLPLVIVGIKGKYQRDLEGLVVSWQGRGRIVLTGWLSSKELSALYRAAKLFVFASKYEGFGFPVLEAMAVGVPVVSSNATSLPELVGDAGLLVDPNDEGAMAAAITRANCDQQLRRDLTARGREQSARFTWRAAAEGTLASYRKAVAENDTNVRHSRVKSLTTASKG
jgi:glycosyltransferase involved in cell wall biosynthesis